MHSIIIIKILNYKEQFNDNYFGFSNILCILLLNFIVFNYCFYKECLGPAEITLRCAEKILNTGYVACL